MKIIVFAAAWLLVGSTAHSAQTVVGTWQGKLPEPSNFRLVFRIESAADGFAHGVLYQPDLSADGIVLSTVTFLTGELNMTQVAMDLSYRGRINVDRQMITGSLTRGGKSYPLDLHRATPEMVWKYQASVAPPPIVSSPDLAFEVATIKPSRPDTPRSIRTKGRIFSTTGTTIENLIAFAWQLRAPRIDGEPGWAKTEKFDITAEPNAPGQPTEDQDRQMLQKLLAERFKMKFHMSKKEFSVLALGLEETHTRLVPSEPEFWRGSIYTKEMSGGETRVEFVGQSMSMFADTLMNFIRERQIVDETGLAGHFNFSLNVATGDLTSTSEDVRSDAVRRAANEAGFKLSTRRVSLSVLIVDGLEKPTPD